MIGSRVATLRPPPGRALTCLVVGVGIIALGVGGGLPTLVPVAACPLAIGLCLFFIGERRFQARFAPDALDISRPRQTIPYRSILEVRPLRPPGKPRPHSFPIQVVHARGGIVIPPRLTAPSERVYAFLRSFVPERQPRILPPALEDYRVEQEGTFGADRVWCYGGRRGTDLPRVRDLRALAAGFAATAAVWLGLPLLRPAEPGWWVGAAVTGIIGGLLFALDLNIRRRSALVAPLAANRAALVISPLGLAVQQGELSGHLTWQEIRKVNLRSVRGSLVFRGSLVMGGAQNLPGILLEVEGTNILLTDSYDRPLSEIHDSILRYWR